MIFKPPISNLLCVLLLCLCGVAYGQQSALTLESSRAVLKLDGFFFETASGRTVLPSLKAPVIRAKAWTGKTRLADGRIVSLMVTPQNGNFVIRLSAEPAADIVKWGLTIDSRSDEYYTGLMERVVDGPQALRGRRAENGDGLARAEGGHDHQAHDLRLCSFLSFIRGYAIFVQGNWPGYFDFCVDDPQRVKIEFEGPSFEMKVYTADPADAGSGPRSRCRSAVHAAEMDVHALALARRTHATATYYDGTAGDRPLQFGSHGRRVDDEGLRHSERRLLDRSPVGTRLPWGYDDFEIDENRVAELC